MSAFATVLARPFNAVSAAFVLSTSAWAEVCSAVRWSSSLCAVAVVMNSVGWSLAANALASCSCPGAGPAPSGTGGGFEASNSARS